MTRRNPAVPRTRCLAAASGHTQSLPGSDSPKGGRRAGQSGLQRTQHGIGKTLGCAKGG